jgi:hypothetical protein
LPDLPPPRTPSPPPFLEEDPETPRAHIIGPGFITAKEISQISYRERVRAHTYAEMGLTALEIARRMRRSRQSITRVLEEPTTPRIRRRRGYYALDTPTRVRVLTFVRDREHRFDNYNEVIHALGLTCRPRVLSRLLREHNLGRFVAKEVTLLSPFHRATRLAFARAVEHWGPEDWLRIG